MPANEHPIVTDERAALAAVTAPAAVEADPVVGTRALTGSARRFLHSPAGVGGGIVIVAVTLAALVWPFFAPDPNAANVADALQTTGPGHLLGTDDLGRDILARLLAGGRVALIVSLSATALGLVFAMLLGVAAGYFGGIVDDLLSRAFDVIVTFPMILLAVLIVVAIGPSITGVSVAIAVAIIPRYGRQFRVLTIACVQREFVQAVIAQGYSSLRVIVRHVLPNILLPIGVIALGNMGRVVVTEASLSFLGAGVQPPDASWGNMIAEGGEFLQSFPPLALYPGIVLCVLAISFSFVGDALRDAFDLTE
jgi:peptide/nickel transport system permease protein